MAAPVRLQRYLAAAGVAARRKAETLITAGRVTVNGEVVRVLGTKVDPDNDMVQVDGEAVAALDTFYVLLNKPKACITAVTDDRGRPTVMDYLPNLPVPVKPVGRLDFYTEGVLLLTNDGELAARLLAPANHVPKTYHVKVHGRLEPDDIKLLREGIQLDDGMVTMPAEIAVLPGESKHTWLAITIHEGKHRQIHRMVEALGYRVDKLQRVAFATLTFHDLRIGDARELTQMEVNQLRDSVGLDHSAVARGSWHSSRETTDIPRRARAKARAEAEAELDERSGPDDLDDWTTDGGHDAAAGPPLGPEPSDTRGQERATSPRAPRGGVVDRSSSRPPRRDSGASDSSRAPRRDFGAGDRGGSSRAPRGRESGAGDRGGSSRGPRGRDSGATRSAAPSTRDYRDRFANTSSDTRGRDESSVGRAAPRAAGYRSDSRAPSGGSRGAGGYRGDSRPASGSSRGAGGRSDSSSRGAGGYRGDSRAAGGPSRGAGGRSDSSSAGSRAGYRGGGDSNAASRGGYRGDSSNAGSRGGAGYRGDSRPAGGSRSAGYRGDSNAGGASRGTGYRGDSRGTDSASRARGAGPRGFGARADDRRPRPADDATEPRRPRGFGPKTKPRTSTRTSSGARRGRPQK
jgi:23S rRNA pseudouridine2605 synthase